VPDLLVGRPVLVSIDHQMAGYNDNYAIAQMSGYEDRVARAVELVSAAPLGLDPGHLRAGAPTPALTSTSGASSTATRTCTA
jgi:hypothetical protein